MSVQPQYDVFLAHNSQDKPQVRAVAKELRQRGLNPWLDEEQIAPGRWFQDVIQQAIPGVKSAAIFIGPGGLGKWQELELRAFISQCVEANIPVIPVLLPGVDKLPTHLLFLSQLNWVRFTSGIDDVEALANLEWGITGRKPEVISKANSQVSPPSVEVEQELNDSDREILTDLLIRSGRTEYSARKALCIKIGIDPNQLGFLRQSNDADFALELISYLHSIDDKQALCKICKELEVVFKRGKYAANLEKIKSKIIFNNVRN